MAESYCECCGQSFEPIESESMFCPTCRHCFPESIRLASCGVNGLYQAGLSTGQIVTFECASIDGDFVTLSGGDLLINGAHLGHDVDVALRHIIWSMTLRPPERLGEKN